MHNIWPLTSHDTWKTRNESRVSISLARQRSGITIRQEELVAFGGHGGNDGVVGTFPTLSNGKEEESARNDSDHAPPREQTTNLEFVGMALLERETASSVLEGEAATLRDGSSAKAGVTGRKNRIALVSI